MQNSPGIHDGKSASASSPKICVAALQMTSTDSPEVNFEVAQDLIERASAQGADLIVLPENFLCFGRSGLSLLSGMLEAYLEKLRSLAKVNRVALVCGSLPFSADSLEEKFFSSSVVIDSTGKDLARYDKIHLFDADVSDSVGRYRESDTYMPGSKIVTASVLGWNIGLSICYDLRLPELYQQYFREGVQLITVPAAFTYETGQAHWETLLKARAIETQSYVVASNQTGAHIGDRKTWGHSMIVDPWGAVVANCQAELGFCLAELDQKKIEDVRTNMPLLQHKRLV